MCPMIDRAGVGLTYHRNPNTESKSIKQQFSGFGSIIIAAAIENIES